PLVVPPHGSLEVDVVDADGKLVLSPTEVVIRRERDARIWSITWLNSDLGTWRKTTKEGSAIFDVVGLDAALELEDEDGRTWRSKDDPSNPFDQRGSIPPLLVAGERRVVTLGIDPGLREVEIRGRVVEASGGATARRELSIELFVLEHANQDGKASHSWAFGKADCAADGSFTAPLRIDEKERGRALLLVLDHEAGRRDRDSIVGVWSLPIEKVEAWQGGDLGEVRFEAPPVLVSGRVVGADGTPIEGLNVVADCDQDALARDPAVPAWWGSGHRNPSSSSARDGRFTIRGFPGSQKWTVTAWNDEFRSAEDIPIAPVASDLDLRCVRGRNYEGAIGGQVAGRLMLDPDVPRGTLEVNIDAPRSNGERGFRLEG